MDPDYFSNANKNVLSFAMIETQQAVDNLDDILICSKLNWCVYWSSRYELFIWSSNLQFDVKEDPIYSNIKLIAKKANEYGKIAGIHNGTTQYA